jgi:hypothetical protein
VNASTAVAGVEFNGCRLTTRWDPNIRELRGSGSFYGAAELDGRLFTGATATPARTSSYSYESTIYYAIDLSTADMSASSVSYYGKDGAAIQVSPVKVDISPPHPRVVRNSPGTFAFYVDKKHGEATLAELKKYASICK